MVMKVFSELASWFRTLDATSAALFILVFAAGTLFRSPEIKRAVAAQESGWWLELVEPVAGAAIAVALKVLGGTPVVRLRLALSPTYRFRQLARRADTLAAALSNDRNYYPGWVDFEEGLPSLPPPRRARAQLETEIATFKSDLDVLDVRRTPPINDADGWNRAVPELKALMHGLLIP